LVTISFFDFMLLAAALLTLAASLNAISSWWLFELPVHFRPQLAALAALAAAGMAVDGHWPEMGLGLVLLCLNLLPVRRYLIAPPRMLAPHSRTIRVLTFNLLRHMTHPERFRALIADQKPDIIVLTELPEKREPLVAGLEAQYPHWIDDSRGHGGDVLILSRWPARWIEVDRSIAPAWPVVAADVCDDRDLGGCVRIIALHGCVPFGGGKSIRDAQLSTVGRFAREAAEMPVIMIGDLNLTPWARSFAGLLREAGLHDSARARAISATWLLRFPLFGLPIDHILVSRGVSVHESKVHGFVGSDHRPVSAVLQLSR
jgi:endonuclease/exonuclease/phosphatase (EEP) superfamily protein YafD